MFEEFKQQENQDTRKYGGTGLGLAISNKLVNLMESTIELESQKDKGSKFSFILKDLKIYEGKVIRKKKLNFDPKEIKFKGSKVLIVDDVLLNLDLIEGYLNSYNLKIFKALNGKSAISIAKILNQILFLWTFGCPIWTVIQPQK